MAVNLAKSRIFGALIKKRIFQRGVQSLLLLVLFALIALAWGMEKLPGIPDPWPLLYTHATTLLFWVLWFMGLVLTLPLVGRLWCTICPVGFLNDHLSRWGAQKRWPKGVLSWAGIIAVFIVGLLGALYFDVHKSPHSTGLFVSLALLLTVITSLTFERASICKLFCPIGLVLSIYTRVSPVKVAPEDSSICAACETKGCMTRHKVWKRWKFGGKVFHREFREGGCMVALNPRKMDAASCQLCLECVRNCEHENMALFYGKKTTDAPLTTPALVLIVLLTGLVSLALVRTWPMMRDAIAPGVHPSALMVGVWFGLVIPALLIFAPALAHKAATFLSGEEVKGPDEEVEDHKDLSFWDLARQSATVMVGPLLGGHLGLALIKFNAKAAYIAYLPYDLTGVESYMAIHISKTLPLPEMLMELSTLGYVALALLGLGVLFGIREMKRGWKNLGIAGRGVGFISFAALSSLYGALLYHWLFRGM